MTSGRYRLSPGDERLADNLESAAAIAALGARAAIIVRQEPHDQTQMHNDRGFWELAAVNRMRQTRAQPTAARLSHNSRK
jgi:hypothetical protein